MDTTGFRIIGDRAYVEDAFIPVANPEREKRALRAMADENGLIHGLPGGPLQLIGWPEAWAEVECSP